MAAELGKKAKIIVTGNHTGDFLAFYLNDPDYLEFNDTGKWETVLFEGFCGVDLAEFRETAKKFGVDIELRR